MNMDRIIVCICTHGRPVMLAQCLTSLADQSVTNAFSVEIAVIDNEAGAPRREQVETFAKVCRFPVRYVHQPQRGIAAARNAALDAAAEARAGWIAFIDDDEIAEPDWLIQLMAPEYLDTPVLTGARFHVVPEPAPYWHVPSLRKNREGRKLGTATTANVRFSRALLDAGLRFDESLGFAGGEDTLFFSQARLAGFEIRRTERAITKETAHSERLTYFGKMYREYWSGAVGTGKCVMMMGAVRGTLLHNLPAILLMIPGIVELAFSPFFAIAGATAFKRRALSGGKKIAKGIGRAAAIAGHMPQPYRVTVGQ